MPSDEQYGVLLFDDAYEHLDEALKHYVQTGLIGKYFYCMDAGHDGAFFRMSFNPEQVDGRIGSAMTIWIPIQFVKFWAKAANKKGIPGFTGE